MKKNGLRKNFVIWENSISRLKWLQTKCAKGTSESWIINEAILAYHRTENENYKEMKRQIALKITALQDEFKLIEQAEAAAILRSKKELKDELESAFDARTEIRKGSDLT